MHSTDIPEWGSKQQAAEILGYSQRTIDRLIKSGQIRASKVGARVRVDLDSIHDYLNANVIGRDAE